MGLTLIFSSAIATMRMVRQKYFQHGLLALHWIGMGLWAVFTTLGIILLVNRSAPVVLISFPNWFEWTIADTLGYIGYFILIPTLFVLVFYIDSISRTSVEPVKLVITGMISALLITAIVLDPTQTHSTITTLTIISQLMWATFWGFLWVFLTTRLLLHSPDKIRREASLVFVGGLFIGLASFINVFRGLSAINPFFSGLNPPLGLVEGSLSIGSLLVTLTFVFQPKLLYILPFKVSRLTVINEGGIPLFSHYWVPEEDDPSREVLFGGMMTGISGILKESLRHGNIREITLEQSILLINYNEETLLTFLLVTSKISKSLVGALSLFAHQFQEEFKEFVSLQDISTKKFIPAKDIVVRCFPFLPTYGKS